MVQRLKTLKKFLVFLGSLSFLLISTSEVYAQTPFPTIAPEPGEKFLGILEGLGPLGKLLGLTRTDVTPAAQTFTQVLSKAIGIITVIGFIWFLFTIFIGAISWLTSGGEKTKLQNAQKQITNGLIGLVLVISAIFLAKLIGTIFGIDFLDITNIIIGL